MSLLRKILLHYSIEVPVQDGVAHSVAQRADCGEARGEDLVDILNRLRLVY
jgi:hypothetical protein